MKYPLILIGGGGHCKSCIDVIEAEGKYEIKGILDTAEKIGTTVLGYTILGSDEDVEKYCEKGWYFLITIGQIKSPIKRKLLFDKVKQLGGKPATVISPTATISKYATINEGTIVMHNVTVNAGASVGNNVILNTGSLIEHEVVIGEHVHVSTHAVINGAAKVEDETFVGSNVIIAQEVTISSKVVIGAGAVVVSNISEAGVYIGNPAKHKMER